MFGQKCQQALQQNEPHAALLPFLLDALAGHWWPEMIALVGKDQLVELGSTQTRMGAKVAWLGEANVERTTGGWKLICWGGDLSS